MQNKIMGSKRCVWLGLIKLNSYFPLHQELCPFQVGRSAVVQNGGGVPSCTLIVLSACLFITALASLSDCLTVCLPHYRSISRSLPASLSVYLTVSVPA